MGNHYRSVTAAERRKSPMSRTGSGTSSSISTQRGPESFLLHQVRSYVARPSWFSDQDAMALSSELGRISKFQSLRSEDALTWSWFGTLSTKNAKTRIASIQWLFSRIELNAVASPELVITQWPRVPHPNTPSRMGPEVDAVIDDPAALIYVEAKWDAGIGTGKGQKEGQLDDQIVLRRRALRANYKYPDSRLRIVLGISRVVPSTDVYLEADPPEPPVLISWLTWQDLAECPAHPYAEEFERYLTWREKLTS